MSQATRRSPDIPRRPEDLPRAADLPTPAPKHAPAPVPATANPVQQAEPRKVTVRTRVAIEGYELDLELVVELRKLAALPGYLRTHGLEPPARPLAFERTAEGHPICPAHGVPMRPREKQGDTWFSHKTVGAHGEELWCRGYAGPDSLGYGGAVPGDQG